MRQWAMFVPLQDWITWLRDLARVIVVVGAFLVMEGEHFDVIIHAREEG